MKNKTCGECKHFEVDIVAATCEKKRWISDDDTPACSKFEPKVITNGDRIRQMSNEELAEFLVELDDNICMFCKYENCSGECEYGVELWLNAPAESEEER